MAETNLQDDLNRKIGVLTRRETEARILAPLIKALADEFGRERVEKVVSETIISLAREQGASLSAEFGDSLGSFLETLQFWMKDGAMEIEILDQSDTRLDFDVKRCRYAELYAALGIKELGAMLSCNRDYSLIEGFNPDARLRRDKTIMAGDSCCTFRYQFPERTGTGDSDPKP